jgi:hypothetical protein
MDIKAELDPLMLLRLLSYQVLQAQNFPIYMHFVRNFAHGSSCSLIRLPYGSRVPQCQKIALNPMDQTWQQYWHESHQNLELLVGHGEFSQISVQILLQ